jgi:hypothetical protein
MNPPTTTTNNVAFDGDPNVQNWFIKNWFLNSFI